MLVRRIAIVDLLFVFSIFVIAKVLDYYEYSLLTIFIACGVVAVSGGLFIRKIRVVAENDQKDSDRNV